MSEGHATATATTYLGWAAGVAAAFVFVVFVRRRWFSSISDVPGPFLGSFSVLWQIIHAFKGHTEEATIAEHKKHGDFVRIGYNEVSIGHPDAITEVLKSQMNKLGGSSKSRGDAEVAVSAGMYKRGAPVSHTRGVWPPASCTPGGVTVLGRHFEEGVILSVNSWVIHRRREIFGEDADVFNPDRWMTDSGRNMERYLIAFGVGYGQCPGRHLAQLELSKTTAMLIRDYDIRQVEEGKSWRFETHFTAVPYGWPCYVTRRRRGSQGSNRK